ncbi:fibrinogen beta chain isoform X1 [Hypanus sabinus]|uniref:fibrinogen beta chain isoform X1 n=2 Tax=Hypanus sabinus TaxID=79690 RepID=UPI0028C50A56|nr:fibrinogen beta chain isoform X1 [Hypanus sabinus]
MKLIFLCLFSIPMVSLTDFEYDQVPEAVGTQHERIDPRGPRPYDAGSEPPETIQQVPSRNEPSVRRSRFQTPTKTQAQKASQRTFDNDKGGCLFIGNEMGVLCPNGCELRTALLKDEQNMMPVIENLKLQVSNLSRSSKAINIYVERVDNEMHRRESQYLGNSHVLSSYSTELEERFSLIKEKVTQTLPSSIRVMRSLVDSLKEKLKNLEHAVMMQKEYCTNPCVVSCNIPVVSGKECNDIFEKGGRTSQLYLIQPDTFKPPYKVYCDMITDEGGWTLIQNRQDGSVDFGRSWDAYKNGFGNIAYDSGKGFCDTPGEYWLGNDRISQLTKVKTTELLFEMRDWNDDSVKAHYSKFVVQSEVNKYRLSVNGYSGVAGNTLMEGAKSLFGINRTMTIHQDMMFSTYDRDNDGWEPENPTKQCAREDGGGWWYNRCHSANPNGRYYIGGEYTKEVAKHGTDDGIVWMDWKGSWYSLKKMSMKIRPQFTSTVPDGEQIPMQFLTP